MIKQMSDAKQKEGMHRATASNIYPTLAALVKKGYLKGIEEKKGGEGKDTTKLR